MLLSYQSHISDRRFFILDFASCSSLIGRLPSITLQKSFTVVSYGGDSDQMHWKRISTRLLIHDELGSFLEDLSMLKAL